VGGNGRVRLDHRGSGDPRRAPDLPALWRARGEARGRADWYAAVRRDIDQLLVLSAKERGTPKDCFDRIRKEMSKVGQQSWKLMAAKYGVYDPAPATAAAQQRAEQ
jgi:hypothetical protein